LRFSFSAARKKDHKPALGAARSDWRQHSRRPVGREAFPPRTAAEANDFVRVKNKGGFSMENDQLNTLVDATIDLAIENYLLADPHGQDAPAFRARSQAIRILHLEIYDLRRATCSFPVREK
jgi:hypothetical protein